MWAKVCGKGSWDKGGGESWQGWEELGVLYRAFGHTGQPPPPAGPVRAWKRNSKNGWPLKKGEVPRVFMEHKSGHAVLSEAMHRKGWAVIPMDLRRGVDMLDSNTQAIVLWAVRYRLIDL